MHGRRRSSVDEVKDDELIAQSLQKRFQRTNSKIIPDTASSSSKHYRFISWDNGLPPSLADSDAQTSSSVQSARSNGSLKTRKGVILEEVLQHHPLEAEAETLVLAAIEELDPAVDSPKLSTLGMGILPNTPHSSENAFKVLPSSQTKEEETEVKKRLLPKEKKHHHQRQQTMQQRLDGLTDALEAIHGEAGDEPPLHEIMATSIAEAPQNGTSAAIDKHANALLQRRKKTEDMTETPLSAIYAAGVVGDSMSSGINVLDTEQDIESGSDNGHSRKSLYHTSVLLRKKSEGRWKNCMQSLPFVNELWAFLSANRNSVRTYMNVVFWIILPALGASLILFYLAGNPPTGRIDLDASARNGTLINHLGDVVDPLETSASFWVLFICVRQIVTLAIAQATQFLPIDFLCIGRRWTTKYLGPIPTLLVVQSRGWPFLLICWSINNLLMNYGSHSVSFFC